MMKVAPHAGAWIEIYPRVAKYSAAGSLPTRERGLKYTLHHPAPDMLSVAPHAGAWIEIVLQSS